MIHPRIILLCLLSLALSIHETVVGNHIHQVGGSVVCLVGDTSAVRSGAFGYHDSEEYDQMDKEPGPGNRLYPRECLVENNLIHYLGTVEKQVAGIEMLIFARNVIQSLQDRPVDDAEGLLTLTSAVQDSTPVRIGIYRYQKQQTRTLRIAQSWRKDIPQK